MNFKKLFIYAAAFIATATILSSCGDDTLTSPPEVAFVTGTDYTSADATVTAGTQVKSAITATSTEGIKGFKITVKYNGQAASTTVLDSVVSGNPTVFNSGDMFAQSQTAVGDETWTFTVTDKNGEATSVSYKLTTTAQGGTINEYSARLLGSYTNQTLGSFFSTSTGSVYLQADAKANQTAVDFVYFYGATNLATITAPDDADAATIFNGATNGLQTWTTKNATRFKTTNLAAGDFVAASTETALINGYDNAAGTAGSKVNQLAKDQVFAFITNNGKKGLVHVANITTGANGSITINVKVIK